jgi:hypothetical protein
VTQYSLSTKPGYAVLLVSNVSLVLLVLLTLQEVAQQLLPLVAPALLAAGGRYALVGHSMGCWAAYELLLLLQQAGETWFCVKIEVGWT